MADTNSENGQPAGQTIDEKKRLVRKKKRRRSKIETVLALLILSLLLLLALLANRILITIDSGESGVYWKRFEGGTVLDRTYPEGFHLIPPWDKMYIYNVRNQQVTKSVAALSVNGLTIDVHYSIRYRPQSEFLSILHATVGPEYLGVVILPEVEAAIRKIIGQYPPEEIYSSQGSITERVVSEAFLQIEERYIVVDDLLITQIALPEKVRTAIEEKLAQKEMAESYIYRIQQAKKEAQRKIIESKGIATYNENIHSSLSPEVLRWQGIVATKEIAASPNAKVVIIGSDEKGLPIILGNQ